jgi:hypothetical protein
MSTWTSVDDQEPETTSPPTRVLFLFRGKHLCVGWKASADPAHLGWVDELDCDQEGLPRIKYEITHWMPLPALPGDDE